MESMADNQLSDLLTANQGDVLVSEEVSLMRAEIRELRDTLRKNGRDLDKLYSMCDDLRLNNRALKLENESHANRHADQISNLISLGKRTKHLENIVGSMKSEMMPDKYRASRTLTIRPRRSYSPY